MADSVKGKTVYSSVMNRWIFGTTADNKKSAIFKEGYDDPTYMTFKIEFGEWGASILNRDLIQSGITEFALSYNDYDQLPIGLLNCPYEGMKNQEQYWQTNTNDKVFNNTKFYSAFQYLRSRNEDTRAKYLYYFVNGLYEIQHDYPFIFKKISGLTNLEKIDYTGGQRLKTPAKISLECYEGLDLKIRTLFEFYRKAAWDDVYQRWILPENMREFKMIIYVFERRIFQDNEMFTIDDQKHMKMSFGKLNADIPVKAYECMPCEFDISESMSWNDSYSSGTENAEETSKLVINVKNLKTYFKNNLFNSDLAKTYNNNGQTNTNDIQTKIDSIMIYDLVEEMERNNGNIYNNDNITPTNITNTTVNGAKSLFLDKRILLENEEANLNIKSYVWGHSLGGAFYGDNDEAKLSITKSNKQLISISEHDTGHDAYQKTAKSYANYARLEDNELYRGGWGYSLASAGSYDQSKTFWENLGDHINNVLTGSKRFMLISGAANIQYMSNCLIDSYHIPFKAYKPLSNYNNGFGDIKPKDPNLKYRILEDQNYIELEKERELNEQSFKSLNDPRDLPEQDYKELEKEREIQKQTFEELNSRENPEQSFNELEKEREIPSQEFNELNNRTIPEQSFKSLNDPRDLPEQDYKELDKERDLPEQTYKELNKERDLPENEFNTIKTVRDLPEQTYKELDKERDLPEQDYKELDKERDLPKQDYKELEKERKLKEQKYKDLEKARNTDIELMDLLLIARSLPGFKDLTIEDIRKIPKQDLIELKEAEERSVPIYNADKSALLESIKDVEGSNMKLLELDRDNKTIEEQALEMLKQNQALSQFKISETTKESSEEKANKLKNILAFTKDFVENNDKIKKAYVTNILEMKSELKNVTREIVNKLPINDTYIIKKGEKDHNNINSTLMSQNDVDQINRNMKFLAINDNDIEKLSFQTLISIQDDLSKELKRSKDVVGLTEVVKNSVATNPGKTFRKNAKNSVIEEPKKNKMDVIY